MKNFVTGRREPIKFFVFLIFFVFVFLLSASVFAGTFQLGFEWDCNTEEIVTGYRLYQGTAAGGPYTAVKDVEGRETCEVWHDFTTPDGVQTQLFFVVTALGTENRESDYSNEVNWTFDFRVMPPATELAAELQGDDILFTWKQADVERVKTWGLYRSETSGGPYTKLLEIKYTGQAGPQYSETVEMIVPEGEMKTYFFVLVTVSDHGVSSIDSNQVKVVIDKRVLAPVYNFKLKVSE